MENVWNFQKSFLPGVNVKGKEEEEEEKEEEEEDEEERRRKTMKI